MRYSSCVQAKALVEGIKKRGWRSSFSFAQKADPCVGIFSKVTATFRPLEANCSVVVEPNLPSRVSKAPKGESGHRTKAENIWLYTDSSSIQEVHPGTLEPVQHQTAKILHPDLSGPLGSAHSQRDPQTGDLFNFNLAFGPKPIYRIYRVNAPPAPVADGEASSPLGIMMFTPTKSQKCWMDENALKMYAR